MSKRTARSNKKAIAQRSQEAKEAKAERERQKQEKQLKKRLKRAKKRGTFVQRPATERIG